MLGFKSIHVNKSGSWQVTHHYLNLFIDTKMLHHVSASQPYCDVIMGAVASQISSLTIVYSTAYSDADERKHQSSASLAIARGIHRGPVNSPHKWPVTRKMFPFDDVIISTLSRARMKWSIFCIFPINFPYIWKVAVSNSNLPNSVKCNEWCFRCFQMNASSPLSSKYLFINIWFYDLITVWLVQSWYLTVNFVVMFIV